MGENMDALAKEEKRAYFKKWREANREKVKKYNATYWKKRAERKLAEKKGIQL